MQENQDLQCYYCMRTLDIQEVKMLCTHCKDFYLCIDCYLIKIEIKMHKNTHLMIPVSDYDYVLWPDGFTLQDDLMLLNSIQQHGFGSWHFAKQYLKRPETEPLELLVKHFFTVFGLDGILNSPTKLQIHTQNVQTSVFQQMKPIKDDYSRCKDAEDVDVYVTAYSKRYELENSYFISQFQKQSLQLMSDSMKTKFDKYIIFDEMPTVTGEGNGQDYFIGCWPKRFEVVYEYINKAEYPIMHMHFQYNENKDQMNFKIQVLQAYAFRLVMRQLYKMATFQNSLHTVDEKIDQITINADLKALQVYNKSIALQNISSCDYNCDNSQLNQFEQQHRYLFRGFKTRLEFRRYLNNLQHENELRQHIFRLQTSRMLNLKQIQQLAEGKDVNFLRQQQLYTQIDMNTIPPGIINTQQSEKCFTVDNKLYFEEFQNDPQQQLKNNIDKMINDLVQKDQSLQPMKDYDYNHKLQSLLQQNFKIAGDVTKMLEKLNVTLPAQKEYICELLKLQSYLNFQINHCVKCKAVRKYHCKQCCSKVCFNTYLKSLRQQVIQLCQSPFKCDCPYKHHTIYCLHSIFHQSAVQLSAADFFGKYIVDGMNKSYETVINETALQQYFIYNQLPQLGDKDIHQLLFHQRIFELFITLHKYIDIENNNQFMFNRSISCSGSLINMICSLFGSALLTNLFVITSIVQLEQQQKEGNLQTAINKLKIDKLMFLTQILCNFGGISNLHHIANLQSFIVHMIQLPNYISQQLGISLKVQQNSEQIQQLSEILQTFTKIGLLEFMYDKTYIQNVIDNIQLMKRQEDHKSDFINTQIIQYISDQLRVKSEAITLYFNKSQEQHDFLQQNKKFFQISASNFPIKLSDVLVQLLHIITNTNCNNYSQLLNQFVCNLDQLLISKNNIISKSINQSLQKQNLTVFKHAQIDSYIQLHLNKSTCQGGWKCNSKYLYFGIRIPCNAKTSYMVPHNIALIKMHDNCVNLDFNFNLIPNMRKQQSQENLSKPLKQLQTDQKIATTKQSLLYQSMKPKILVSLIANQFGEKYNIFINQTIFTLQMYTQNVCAQLQQKNGYQQQILNTIQETTRCIYSQNDYILSKESYKTMNMGGQHLNIKLYYCKDIVKRRNCKLVYQGLKMIEVAYCSLFRISIQNYLLAKQQYIENGHIISYSIYQNLLQKPFACEIFGILLLSLGYATIAQNNAEEKDRKFITCTSQYMFQKSNVVQQNGNTKSIEQNTVLSFTGKPELFYQQQQIQFSNLVSSSQNSKFLCDAYQLTETSFSDTKNYEGGQLENIYQFFIMVMERIGIHTETQKYQEINTNVRQPIQQYLPENDDISNLSALTQQKIKQSVKQLVPNMQNNTFNKLIIPPVLLLAPPPKVSNVDTTSTVGNQKYNSKTQLKSSDYLATKQLIPRVNDNINQLFNSKANK